jgi:hypothetical protein
MDDVTSRRDFLRTAAAAAGERPQRQMRHRRARTPQDTQLTRTWNTAGSADGSDDLCHQYRRPLKRIRSSPAPTSSARTGEVMNACLDNGINYVDACSAYGSHGLRRSVKAGGEVFVGFDWTMARAPEIAGSPDRRQGLDEAWRSRPGSTSTFGASPCANRQPELDAEIEP